MAKPEVTITFYSLDECGFYERKTVRRLFGDMDSTLSELSAWTTGRNVSATGLSSPSKVRREKMPVYIMGVERSGADWVLATWNSVPGGDSTVASLASDSVVGKPPTVHDNPVAANSIPGFPTYFWFIPAENVFATLRFEIPITAVRPMLGYLQQFLKTESGYVVKDEGKIVGYRDLGGSGKPLHPYVRMSSSIRVKKGKIDQLKRNRAKIRYVLRDSLLQQSVVKDKTMFQRLSEMVRKSTTPSLLTKESKVEIKLQYTPTDAELDEMIQAEQNATGLSDYDDLGFKFSDGQTIWIHKVLSRHTAALNLEVSPNGVLSMTDLAATMLARRGEFLKEI